MFCFFMATVKILQYPDPSMTNLSCGLIAWKLWGIQKTRNKELQNLGSADFWWNYQPLQKR